MRTCLVSIAERDDRPARRRVDEAIRVEPGDPGRDQREPLAPSEEVLVPMQQGGGLRDEPPVLARVGVVRTEYVVPENEPRPVEEAVDDFSSTRPIPSRDRELTVTRDEPPVAVHRGLARIADVAPLRPRLTRVPEVFALGAKLGREDSPPRASACSTAVASACGTSVMVVEHHCASASSAWTISAKLVVGARVPRVVVDHHANAPRMEHVAHFRAEPGQSPRHLAVEVELRPRIEAQPRVGVPQEYLVDAPELRRPLIDERRGPVAAAASVEERLVVHEEEELTEGGVAPRRVGIVVNRRLELRLREDPGAFAVHRLVPAGPHFQRGIVEADVRIGRRSDFVDHQKPCSRAISGN